MHIELRSENSSVTWQEIVTEKTSIIFGPNALFMNWYWHHLIQSVFSSAWASDALFSMFLKLRLLNFTSQCCLTYLTLCGIYLMDNVHIFKINTWFWHLSFAVSSYHWSCTISTQLTIQKVLYFQCAYSFYSTSLISLPYSFQGWKLQSRENTIWNGKIRGWEREGKKTRDKK